MVTIIWDRSNTFSMTGAKLGKGTSSIHTKNGTTKKLPYAVSNLVYSG